MLSLFHPTVFFLFLIKHLKQKLIIVSFRLKELNYPAYSEELMRMRVILN